jgi:PKD repeat protein
VQVKDANSNTATQALSIVVTSVVAPPTCAVPTVTSGTNSLAVTATSNCTDSGSTISISIDWGDDSAISSGTSANHTYAAAGTYTITVTAINASNLTSSASASVTVSAPVPTPVPQGQPMGATVNVVAPPGGDITVTYSCTSADGPQGIQPLSAYYLTGCTVTGPDNSSTMTLTDTPQPVTISVNTTGPTTSQSAAHSRQLGGLYSAFLFLPGIVLLGVGFSRPLRGKPGRYASAALLGLMMLSWLACGGGTIAPPPNQNLTPSGAYGINVTGTSSTGTTVTITVGFTVTIG